MSEKKNLQNWKIILKMKPDKKNYEKYMQAFIEQNSRVNLVSKNDEKFLWEKHIFDSLAIGAVFDKYGMPASLLDIGTGGGFPAVPIALEYPEIEVYALDSIRKKINAIENIKSELDINNLHTICERAEKITEKFDVVTSRAVAPLKVITEYAIPRLKPDGIFVAYKSLKTQEEISDAAGILKKYNAKVADVIEYSLPLNEKLTRNLIVINI